MTTSIDVAFRFPATMAPLAILDRFEELAKLLGIEAAQWSASNSGDSSRTGGFAALRKYVSSRESEVTMFSLDAPRSVLGICLRKPTFWLIRWPEPNADQPFLASGIAALRAVSKDRELIDGCVRREPYGTSDFPLSPPIADQCYAVLVTDAQVEEAYDAPDVFWQVWDTVETIDDRKLCVRAVKALDWERWLGKTFENTMDLARAAKPNRTVFPLVQLTGEEGPWWDYGDVQDEKAGWPMLDLVGYEPKTRTLEYAAKPNHDGHVLIQELQTLKGIVQRGSTSDGKPLDAVRVVFADEARARSEKRPLLDVGAKVYYLDQNGELVELTS